MKKGRDVRRRLQRRGRTAGLTEEHPDRGLRVVSNSPVPSVPEVILPGAGPEGPGPETEPPLVGDESESPVERDVLNKVCGHGDEGSVSGGRSVERVRVKGDDGVSVVTWPPPDTPGCGMKLPDLRIPLRRPIAGKNVDKCGGARVWRMLWVRRVDERSAWRERVLARRM